ncbi:helix-turn-helix transcriptional regulator [Hymenobacter algoricola]|uniref:HTH cro/C1-type domain-containing protein n=1 Tax=Hymenobacter algoricola TaxID=486267 RepID=A0ABP7N587_9BACT
MDWIPAKLRAIRQQLGLTQAKAAEASGLSQRDVSQLENGRKEGIPKEYMQFLHSQGIDLNWLFTPAAAAPEAATLYAAPAEPAALVQESGPAAYGGPRPPQAAPAIRMVDVAAGRQYPQRYQEPGFCEALPVLGLPLPQVQQGTFRCFQVGEGSLVLPLQPLDWVVARYEEPAAALPTDGALYVEVTREALLVARMLSTGATPGEVALTTDDQQQTPLARRAVVELWRVVAHLSFQVAAPASGLSALAANYQDLLDRVQRLEQKR